MNQTKIQNYEDLIACKIVFPSSKLCLWVNKYGSFVWFLSPIKLCYLQLELCFSSVQFYENVTKLNQDIRFEKYFSKVNVIATDPPKASMMDYDFTPWLRPDRVKSQRRLG